MLLILQKVAILAALMAPVVTAAIVLATTWITSERSQQRFIELRTLIVAGLAAGVGVVVAAAVLGPFRLIDNTILLRPLAENTAAIGLAGIATIILGLVVYLPIRRLEGFTFALALAAAAILTALPFLGAQAAIVSYLENTEPSRRFDYSEVNLNEAVNITTPALVTEVASGFKFITSLSSDPAGRVVYAEFRTGVIGILESGTDGTFDGKTLAEVPLPKGLRVHQGLWHVLVDPDGNYLYASAIDTINPIRDPEAQHGAGDTTRVVRFPYNDAKLGTMETFLSGLPAGLSHGGGAMTFDDAGNFYLTIGDNESSDLAFVQNNLMGAIIRLTPDGGIPDDNPNDWSPVYAHGFRNPYGIAYDEVSGLLYVTDNGPRCCDRLIRVEPGRFHGWPQYGRQPSDIHELRNDNDVVPPLIETGESTPSPTQLVLYHGDRYGSEFDGNLFFATFNEGAIHRVVLSSDGRSVVSDEIVFRFEQNRPIIGVTATTDGYIYFASNSSIYRIDTFGSGN